MIGKLNTQTSLVRGLADDIEELVDGTCSHLPPSIQSELGSAASRPAPPLLAHPASLQEALESASEREAVRWTKLLKRRSAGVTEMDMVPPAWVGELIQLVRAVALDERPGHPQESAEEVGSRATWSGTSPVLPHKRGTRQRPHNLHICLLQKRVAFDRTEERHREGGGLSEQTVPQG